MVSHTNKSRTDYKLNYQQTHFNFKMREAEYFARYILISGRELGGSTLGMLKLGVT